MKLIKPSYEILSPIDKNLILQSIERAGRTCYKSEDKITEDSSEKFIKMLISRGHESVLEHEKLTILFVCDRGVSHEIVRHRICICSFSQESTRYCNYANDKFGNQITYIIPAWFERTSEGLIHDVKELNNHIPEGVNVFHEDPRYDYDMEFGWGVDMLTSEIAYNKKIKGGWRPEQARSVLPNSLKTEIVVTANMREWRTIFKQRTSKAAHPQMRELMIPLLEELKVKLPVIFDDINVEK